MLVYIASAVCIVVIFLLHLRKCGYVEAKCLQEQARLANDYEESLSKIFKASSEERRKLEQENKSLKEEIHSTIEHFSNVATELHECRENFKKCEERYQAVKSLNAEQAAAIGNLRNAIERFKQNANEIKEILADVN